MDYLVFKSLHIIGVVSWFAGLFYLVRLFVYYAETKDKSPAEQNILQPQYLTMMDRLYKIITTPAMVITVVAGGGMLILRSELLSMGWMQAKLVLVFSLFIYHWYCGRIIKQISSQSDHWKSFRFRLFNEVATLLLVAIVFLAVMKNGFNAIYGILGFILLGLVIFIAAKWYKKSRERKLKSK